MCTHGWMALSQACYHLTPSPVSHQSCVQTCERLDSTLACITDTQKQHLATSLASSAGADVWIGHYLSADDPISWDVCVSGESANASSFAPWAPDQPNAPRSEHCVALWTEADYLWRDAPCSLAARCLCERSLPSQQRPLPLVSSRYLAFADAEQEFYERQRSMAYTWLLIAYLLVVPAFSLAPFLCLYLCPRRLAARTSSARMEATRAAARAAAAAVANPAAQIADEPTVRTLRAAEEEAHRLWTRVSGSLLVVGMVSFWCVTLPQTLPFVPSIETYRAVKLVASSKLDLLSSLAPWSLGLLGLAIRPIDVAGVAHACTALFALLLAVALVMATFIMFQPAYAVGFGDAPVWVLLLSLMLVLLLLFPVTSFAPERTTLTPREQLARFWLCFRTATVVYSAFALLSALRPLLLGRRLVFTGLGDIKVSFLVAVASCAGAALTFTRSVRGWFQMWLGSHFLTQRGTKLQEASFLAGLIRGMPAADAYAAAKALFRGLPINRIPCDILFGYLDAVEVASSGGSGGVGRKVSDQTFSRHGQRSRSEELRAATRPAELGGVAAFVSYSWADDGPAQLAQLLAWASEQPATRPGGGAPMVWIDRCCIYRANLDLSLACLPIHVAGCNKFLVLAGPTYSGRLWCALELLVFVRMGGPTDDIEVRLAVPTDLEEDEHTATRSSILKSLSVFDAAKAQCHLNKDRQQILAAVETSFGATAPFSKLVRDIVDEKVRKQQV